MKAATLAGVASTSNSDTTISESGCSSTLKLLTCGANNRAQGGGARRLADPETRRAGAVGGVPSAVLYIERSCSALQEQAAHVPLAPDEA